MTAPRDIDVCTYDNIPREQVAPLLRKNLPAVVRKLKAFVVFKFKPPKKAGGKRMKLPFYVVDGRMRHGEQDSQSDRTRLVSFPAAVKLFEQDPKWGGIGVCALESNDCFFVDLDNCFNEHLEPNALAQTLLAWNTYTEYSPSGRGLRMVFGGNPGVNRKRHDLGLELFCSSGFVTLTGLRYDKAHADVKQLTTRQQQKLAELLGTPLVKQEQDLNSIPSPIDKNRRKDINRALHKMDPDMGYAQWLMVGQALHSGDPDPAGWGFQKWLSWSQGGDKFEQTNEQEMLRKWHGFKQGKGITVNTLFGIAKEYGFNPKELADNDNNDKKEEKGHKLADFRAPGEDAHEYPEEKVYPLAENIFDNCGAYMFIGRAKIGKSRILGALVAGALTGGNVLDFQFNKKCKVLAFTLEESPSSLVSRVQAYMVDPEEHKGRFKVISEKAVQEHATQYGDTIDWAEWLELVIAQTKPDFVYIDTPVKLRMIWQKDPDYKSKKVTEQDYQDAQWLDAIAQRHRCVIVSVIHGSKRKSRQDGFDPFESIGTTSWTLGGCTGALVLMDKPGHNPMEQEDDGQKVFSVRGRYLHVQGGDLHFLMQSNPNGTFTNMGSYHYVQSLAAAEEFLRIIADLMREGAEFVTAQQVSTLASKSSKTVKTWLHRAAQDGVEYEGRKLVAVQGSGYALMDKAHKGPTKRPKKPTSDEDGLTPEQRVLRDRARRKMMQPGYDPLQ